MLFISLLIFTFLVLGFVLLKWLFQPYFNWKNQKRISQGKQDDIIVLFQNTQYNYNEFKNPSKDLELSIIIPSYNEENRLGKTLQESFKYFSKYKYEIIVVNDSSRDRTLEVAKSFQNDNYKIVSYNVNKGKGGAVRIGMLIAVGRVQLFMDADLATDINDYPRCFNEINKIQKNDLGIVAGSRYHLAEKVVIKRKWYRNILNYCSNFITSKICGVSLRDTQCGFKLFTQKTAQIIFQVQHLERWAFDVELFMIAKQYKVPVTEVPVNWRDVEGSHLNVVDASLTMTRDFILVRLLYLLRIWKFNDSIGLRINLQ